jgi:hypothetical protein
MAISTFGTTVVSFDGTNATSVMGPIYLRDIGQRNQLGGGKGIYVNGQDQYLDYGTDATFVSTSDVMLSVTKGEIYKLVNAGILTTTSYAAA